MLQVYRSPAEQLGLPTVLFQRDFRHRESNETKYLYFGNEESLILERSWPILLLEINAEESNIDRCHSIHINRS